MNKKLTWGTVFLFSLCLLMFSACSDDDDHAPAGPIINLTEIGHGNNKTGIVGKDLHLEGTIVADGIVRRIDIEIHPENGDGFRLEKSYTEGKYIGVKNADFHEHIDIPAEAPAGDYHLHFSVTDQSGQMKAVTSELTILRNP